MTKLQKKAYKKYARLNYIHSNNISVYSNGSGKRVADCEVFKYPLGFCYGLDIVSGRSEICDHISHENKLLWKTKKNVELNNEVLAIAIRQKNYCVAVVCKRLVISNKRDIVSLERRISKLEQIQGALNGIIDVAPF